MGGVEPKCLTPEKALGIGVCLWSLFSKNKDLRLGIPFSPISWRRNLFLAKEGKSFHQGVFMLMESAALALLEAGEIPHLCLAQPLVEAAWLHWPEGASLTHQLGR